MCEHNKRNNGQSYCAYCAVSNVRVLHAMVQRKVYDDTILEVCGHCSSLGKVIFYPCSTIKSLDGEQE